MTTHPRPDIIHRAAQAIRRAPKRLRAGKIPFNQSHWSSDVCAYIAAYADRFLDNPESNFYRFNLLMKIDRILFEIEQGHGVRTLLHGLRAFVVEQGVICFDERFRKGLDAIRKHPLRIHWKAPEKTNDECREFFKRTWPIELKYRAKDLMRRPYDHIYLKRVEDTANYILEALPDGPSDNRAHLSGIIHLVRTMNLEEAEWKGLFKYHVDAIPDTLFGDTGNIYTPKAPE